MLVPWAGSLAGTSGAVSAPFSADSAPAGDAPSLTLRVGVSAVRSVPGSFANGRMANRLLPGLASASARKLSATCDDSSPTLVL